MANIRGTPVTIFYDLQKVFEAIKHFPSYKKNRVLRGIIYCIAKTL